MFKLKFLVKVICVLLISNTRHTRAHTEKCVKINPNGDGSQEPYYLCIEPELPVGQVNNPIPSEFVKGKGVNYATQNLQFGNAYHQPLNVPAAVKTNRERIVPIKISQNIHQENKQRFEMSNGHPAHFTNHHYEGGQQFTPNNPQLHTYSNIPKMYESIPQPSARLSKTDTSQLTENPNAGAEAKGTLINNAAQEGNEGLSPQPKVNAKEFKALIENEVLGTPNLQFSYDEMLPLHNMYPEAKQEEMILGSVGPIIPLEYLNDPILRTFYNINEQSIQSKIKINHQSVFNQPSLTQDTKSGCVTETSAPQLMPAHYETPANQPPNSNTWCGCPFTFQPIFLAIPWVDSTYHDMLQQMHPISCGELQNINGLQQNTVYPLHYSHIKQPRVSPESITNVSEDLNNTKTEIHPGQTNSTKPFEEDPFAEDTTLKNDKINKNNDENKKEELNENEKQDMITTTTTDVPFTTVRTFKTIMHAAKMHSKLAMAEQNQNKRHTHYLGGGEGVYPYNLRKQYIRKLPGMQNN